MENTKISNIMYQALETQYQSEMLNAQATILVYFNNPVAIGEHPQHLEEMDKLLDKMSTAQDKLDMLNKFKQYG